jgi:SAM-dependent methyltransferase
MRLLAAQEAVQRRAHPRQARKHNDMPSSGPRPSQELNKTLRHAILDADAQALNIGMGRSSRLTARDEAKPSTTGLEHRDVVKALYLGLLDRYPDDGGLNLYLAQMRRGTGLSDIIRDITNSEEFKSRVLALLAPRTLPNLTELYPQHYVSTNQDSAIFRASNEKDFTLLESLIKKHRYYDSSGVWTSTIDVDKCVTAAIVRGLGARNCLELGCFTGSVLSVLADYGVDAWGVEVSHLALLLAHANVHERILFGDLLDLNFHTSYDTFLAMDILEHLSPFRLDLYLDRIAQITRPTGFVFLNSPMFGPDDIFGNAFDVYLPEWRQAGTGEFWRHIHCDAKGWPMHGHLVWASPQWWEQAFLKHGLVRDRDIESLLHGLLESFFRVVAPSRRSFFVLRRSHFRPDVEAIGRMLSSTILPIVAGVARDG